MKPMNRLLLSPSRHNSAAAVRIQRGVGLIEVLVAILILALGLLGMAGLQSRSLQTNQSSYARSQAVMMSYYILDVMRADRAAATAGNYDVANLCNATAITGSTLADNSRKDWINSLKSGLGDTTATCGAISCTVAGMCTVKVIWDDQRGGGLGAQTFETSSHL
jgi:type IV pilus assembly protein PilV